MKSAANKPTHVTHGNVLDDLDFSPEHATALKFNSALNFSAVACSGEKSRSSSTFPCVTCVGLLAALFMSLLLCQTRLHCLEPLLCLLEIFSRHLPAFLLEAVKNVDHVIYPR